MRPPMDRIRVLIADDEQSVLDVLTAVMDAESDLEVAASDRDAETAIQLATREQPDVAILDVRMPGGGGPRAAREILRRSPTSRVIALSAHEEVDSVLEMLRAGALGYVVKGESTGPLTIRGPSPPRSPVTWRTRWPSKCTWCPRAPSSGGRSWRTGSAACWTATATNSTWPTSPSSTSRTTGSWGWRHSPDSPAPRIARRTRGSPRPVRSDACSRWSSRAFAPRSVTFPDCRRMPT